MPRVLLIGIKSDAVDFSDPDLPAGMDAAKIQAGIDATLSDMKGRGWQARFCGILPDETAEATISEALGEEWDCIVVGGGIRIPAANLALFERVINTIHRNAPRTPIAFNSRPENSADAAARWLEAR